MPSPFPSHELVVEAGTDLATAQVKWDEVVSKLQLQETPYLLPLGCNTAKARKQYNNLAADRDQLGPGDAVPGVGLLRAKGLNNDQQHLAKLFGALLIAANARHLLADGDITDIVIFRTSGGGSPAALVNEAGLAAVRSTANAMSEHALRNLCRPSGRRPHMCQPDWEQMNVMAQLGISHDFITGLPLLDTREVTNPSSGLSKEEQDEFLRSLSDVLHDLARALKSPRPMEPLVDMGTSVARFFQSLTHFRSSHKCV